MIRAEHKKWAELLFDPYLAYLLKKNFNGFYAEGSLPDLEKYPGLIITPNHFSWWDGFITYYLLRKLTFKKIFTMMLEEQLNKYWFFRNVGAFSINPSNPVSMARTLNYTCQVLNEKTNIVVLYPQGEIRPLNTDDIIIRPGLKLLTSKNRCGNYVLPLALKIEYGRNKKPDIAVSFGRILSSGEINKDYDVFAKEFVENIKHLNNLSDFRDCRNLF